MAGLLEYLLGSHMGGAPALPVPGMMPEEPDEAALAEEARRIAAQRTGAKAGMPPLPIPAAGGLPLPGLLNSVPYATPPAGFDALDRRASLAQPMPSLLDAPLPPTDTSPPSAFDAGGAPPIPGVDAVANLMRTGGNGGMPPTNDPLSGEPQIVGDVPLPRPRPVNGIGDDPGVPMSLAPADYNDVLPPNATTTQGRGLPIGDDIASNGKSLFDRIFDPNKAATWMALGSGFAGAGSIGTGMRRGFGAAVPAMIADRAQMQKQGGMAETYRALVARGVAPQEALAATRSPELMRALVAKHFETKPAVVVNGRLVREKPDGSVQTIADYSDDKDRLKLGEGWQWKDPKDHSKGWTFIPDGPQDPKVKAQNQRQSEPPSFEWVDPLDHSKGQRAIKGGKGERVDAQVAARLGLAQSFLDQLPEIKRRVEAGEATGGFDAVMAKLGYGNAGEVRRQIQSGAEALLRNLTGAGMNLTEASKYVQRYELEAHDTAAKVISKLNQLGRELLYTDEAVRKGRGGTIRVTNGQVIPIVDDAAPTSGKTKGGISYSMEP